MKTQDVRKSTVVIIEDHPMFRERLTHLITKTGKMTVVGEADNVRDGLQVIKKTQPGVAVIDISLKGSNGLELLKDLRAHGLRVPVLVLSMHDEALYAERALRAGARGAERTDAGRGDGASTEDRRGPSPLRATQTDP